jgi:DNA-binding Xre family transcriptional regulator
MGMIEVTIKERAEKCGITNAHQLQKAMGVSPTLAARLWSGDFKMIGVQDTLSNLCRVLRCQPDKLLKYVPDRE